MTANVISVEDIAELRGLIEATPNLVVKYWATWCGPCRMFAPTFDKAAEQVDAKFVAVDIDKVPEVSVDYGVMSVPQVHQWKDGEQTQTLVGAQRLIPLINTLTA